MPPAKNARNAKPSGPPPSEDFVFTASNGAQIVLPPMSRALNAAELRKHRNSNPLDMIYYVIERDHPDDPEIFDDALSTLDLEEGVPELVKQWQDFSKASLGESSAS